MRSASSVVAVAATLALAVGLEAGSAAAATRAVGPGASIQAVVELMRAASRSSSVEPFTRNAAPGVLSKEADKTPTRPRLYAYSFRIENRGLN